MTKNDAWDKLVTVWNTRKRSSDRPLQIMGIEVRTAGISEEQIDEFIQEGRMRKCRLLNDYGLLIYKTWINK